MNKNNMILTVCLLMSLVGVRLSAEPEGCYTNAVDGAKRQELVFLGSGLGCLRTAGERKFFTCEDGTVGGRKRLLLRPLPYEGTLVFDYDNKNGAIAASGMTSEMKVDEDDLDEIPPSVRKLLVFYRAAEKIPDQTRSALRKEAEAAISVQRKRQEEAQPPFDYEKEKRELDQAQAVELKLLEDPGLLREVEIVYPEKKGAHGYLDAKLSPSMQGVRLAMEVRDVRFAEADLVKLLDHCDWDRGILIVSGLLKREELSAESLTRYKDKVFARMDGEADFLFRHYFGHVNLPPEIAKEALATKKLDAGMKSVITEKATGKPYRDPSGWW